MEMVSVIIPTYKGANTVARAIDSVLSQSYQNTEVIVVDDNDPDSEDRKMTEAVISAYSDTRLSYLQHEKNKNGAFARNTGICAAKGEYIAFLDDDDYYLSERIEKSVDYLIAYPDCIGVYVGVKGIDTEGNIRFCIIPDKNLTVRELLLNIKALGTGSNIFLRRNVVVAVNGFDTSYTRKQDLEFMIRVCEQGKIGFISDVLIIKAQNGTNNELSYYKAKSIIDKFTKKFELQIESLGNEKDHYYADQYRYLLNSACMERNKEEILDAISLLNKYDKLTVFELLRVFLYKNKIIDWPVVVFFRRIRREKKSKKLNSK